MPYSPEKTVKLIGQLPHYERLPGSEFLTQVMEQLKEADAHITNLNDELRTATTDKRRANDALQKEEENHAETRDKLRKLRAELATQENVVAAPVAPAPKKAKRSKNAPATSV